MKTMKPLFLLLFLMLSGSLYAQQTPALPPLVTVSGTGEVKVQPDEIMLNLAVDVRNKSLDEARKQNDEKVANILKYLKKYGVDPKNVQTTYMSVQPSYQGEYGQTTPEFYMAQKTISVLVKNISKFDDLLTGIYAAGANRVDGIEFRSSEIQKHKIQARKLALQVAKEKAQMMTTELGTKVGRVYAITENSGGGFPILYRNNMMNKMGEAGAAYDAASGPTISAGQITISTTVEVSFVIEQ